MSDDLRPLCPQCGCPARQIVGMARVRAELDVSGKPGRVLRATRFSAGAAYVCGGGHQWNSTVVVEDKADD